HGDTALHYAACEGHKEAVEVLLNNGADYELENYRGETPYNRAVEEGHMDCASLLKPTARLQSFIAVTPNNKPVPLQPNQVDKL
ncbi:uncharacterized protein LOC102810346, partial [Saccoglossus kowalevskii]|uniref:E3 ubiquitin-protein ligase XBAT32-like n=1 Tax=Saccoglossus kowalevskii TaxID=10224 RepID=A0ABM0M314_SACKO